MRVTPGNQYQLVDKEVDPDIQLASGKNGLVCRSGKNGLVCRSGKNGLVCRCTFFVCFSRPSARLESPRHLKVGPVQNQEALPGPAVFCESKDLPLCNGDDISISKIISLKSSLKKPIDLSAAASGGGGCNKHRAAFCEKNDDATCQKERRKVQWTDNSGGELFQVREFEMSESESDDEFYSCNKKTCSCTIM